MAIFLRVYNIGRVSVTVEPLYLVDYVFDDVGAVALIVTHLAAATTATRTRSPTGTLFLTHSVNRFLVILNIHVSVFIWGNLRSFLKGTHARLVATTSDTGK